MNIELRAQAVMLTEKIMRFYYCQRDIYAVLDHMAPDASWIGPGEREKIYSLEEMRLYFEQGKDAIPSCEISEPELQAVDLDENFCLVTGSMTIRTAPESGMVLEVNQRLSFTFRLTDGVLKVVHMHISNPYGEMSREEYFPHKIGSQSYQYLQRLLREKTEVIDMITGNINGGLKGSNDDSTFSYFYVNEGLPRMLGYTYDEFMKKTGGTATGAVYPPDLPGALADCERCFAKGPAYSSEYRMEKKDGGLIWVLDTGQKICDSEGVIRINSIITDITPLKQALFDLEVERERYRIALNNINGAMCEYDILKDLFTVYRQKEDSGQRMEEMVYSNFSEKIISGGPVHPEDKERFLALCKGHSTGPAEFRTLFSQSESSWHWNQFNCSVIFDINGIPIRSIGMLKDITEDKLNTLKLLARAQRDGLTQLLNQTTVKEVIQTYLTECYGQDEKNSALFMVDLDHFKEVNDFNGHLYGNEVLIKTARILEKVAGSGSVAGRSGGDEFLVLVKDAAPDTAALLAEKIVRQVFEIGSDRNFLISCSVGVACHSGGNELFTELFDRADKALYRAKAKGRNQWAMDEGKTDSKKE